MSNYYVNVPNGSDKESSVVTKLFVEFYPSFYTTLFGAIFLVCASWKVVEWAFFS